MSQRFIIGIGVAFFAVLALGIAAVVGLNTMSEAPVVATQVAPPPAAAPAPAVPLTAALSIGPTAILRPGEDAAPGATSQNSVLETGITVQDADIEKLATAVKLGNTNTGDVGKEVWARETPIAQKLLKGSCDCDQRNWLTHFVETGNYAITGSNNYYESVQLLATLRRSNADLAKNQNFH